MEKCQCSAEKLGVLEKTDRRISFGRGSEGNQKTSKICERQI
jgi:hypothetical protein